MIIKEMKNKEIDTNFDLREFKIGNKTIDIYDLVFNKNLSFIAIGVYVILLKENKEDTIFTLDDLYNENRIDNEARSALMQLWFSGLIVHILEKNKRINFRYIYHKPEVKNNSTKKDGKYE